MREQREVMELLGEVREFVSSVVRECESFPTFDQLDETLPEIAKAAPFGGSCQVGVSRMGNPMRLVWAGQDDGDPNALVVAGSHSNEPDGFLTAVVIARLVSERAHPTAGRTWNFTVSDPDAALLNPWYPKPLTVESYHRELFRAAMGNQPGHTLPIEAGPHRYVPSLPETWAMMGVIDRLRPRLTVDCHSTEDQGAWFPVSEPIGALGDQLRAVVEALGMGFQLAPPAASSKDWTPDGPGVFVKPSADKGFKGFSRERVLSHGGSVDHYARRYGLVLSPETPRWKLAPSELPGDLNRARRETGEELGHSADFLRETFKAVESHLMFGRTLILQAALDTLGTARGMADRWSASTSTDAAAYRAARTWSHMIRLRTIGMLLRALEAEQAMGNVRPPLRKAIASLTQAFEAWCNACVDTLNPVPTPRELTVTLQVVAALLAARRSPRRVA